jgi:hypothetical protein
MIWTEEEIKYLTENYSFQKNSDLAFHLNKTPKAVLNKAGRLNLNKCSDFFSLIERNPVQKTKKIIKYKHTCSLCDYGCNTLKGLRSHLTIKHQHIDIEDYYIKHIGSIVVCHFCEKKGKFINIEKGFRNLCDDPICISKSRNTETPEFLIYKYNLSKDEAIEKYNEIKSQRVKSYKTTIEKNMEENPSFNKERNPLCIEFYTKRGYSVEEGKKHINKIQETGSNISSTFRKENTDECAIFLTNRIEYYLNKGYSLEDAQTLLTNRQTTFSKDICIEKYGEEEGLKVWQARQDKWMNTLNLKSEEEKIKIKHKKLFNNSGFSKSSQELFNSILENLDDRLKEKTYFHQHNGEIIRYSKIVKNCYKLDFVNTILSKCIEFNGDYWHCNPKKYSADYYHKIIKKSAKRIWELDSEKKHFIENVLNYDLLIIWEDDYKKNKKLILEKCIEFLK